MTHCCLLCVQLGAVVEQRADAKLLNKFRACMEDQERVTQLLLLLAGRLARMDNCLAALPSDPSGAQQRVTRLFCTWQLELNVLDGSCAYWPEAG